MRALTVLQFLEYFILHFEQKLIVLLHLVCGIHHQRPHDVGAVGLVSQAHTADNGPEVKTRLRTATQQGSR